MSLETMTKLATYTVGAGGDSSVTFSNIPQTYTDLVIKVSARTARTASNFNVLAVTVNTVTTNQTARIFYSDGSTAFSTLDTSIWPLIASTDAATASIFGNSELTIPNYTSSNYKSFLSEGVNEHTSSSAYAVMAAGLWSSTAAITSLSFASSTGNTLKQYSTFTLYGVKAMRNAVSSVPRATGGTITTSGGYYYHTFTSSGTFTPTGNINNAEVLVIAGGGGGGSAVGGGGGAGGIVYGTGYSLNSPLPVVVGAGGRYTGYNEFSTTGSDSTFGAAIAKGGSGGHGGGGAATATIAAGGSTGGQSAETGSTIPASNQTSATGFTGYGNAGGSRYSVTYAGGGGGAGAVGGNGTSTNGGAGGIGLSTWYNWAAATSTGASGYYGGGGGGSMWEGQGANGANRGAGGLGGGGLAGNTSVNGAAGSANTGGGGGGANATGGLGGSGLVIIRYAG